MKKELAEEMIRRVLPSYEMKEMLGEGSFGAVFRISDSLKERAVKIISLSAAPSIERESVTSATKKIERDFRHIVESYEKIACEEIVTVYDFFKLSDGDDGKRQATAYAVIVMELYPSNLFEYVVEHFEKNEQLLFIATAKSLIEKLARMLGNLYTKRGFLFEDLKPENILVREQEGNLKLVVGDIGGLKNLGSISTTSSQVTLSYCAPEVIRRGQKPDLRSILYSYGIISYFILEGHLPYENYGITERIDMIKDKGVFFDRGDIPVELQGVIRKCMSFDSEERYGDFNEVISAIHGKPVHERDKFSDDTIDLSSFKKRIPQETTPVKQVVDVFRKTIMPINQTLGLKASMKQRTLADVRKLSEATRMSDEKEKDLIENVANEIRDIVIRPGDMYKLQNDSYRVYNDIKIEGDAMLIIENAKLYFDENSGIVSFGTVRAKNTDFVAIDPSKKWKNIVLSPSDTRVNFFDGCNFRFGKGRTWGSIKNTLFIRNISLNDAYSYGGALFIAGIKEKIISINNCNFQNCSAQEGGSIFCLKAHPAIESCVFNNCSAGLGGGAISCLDSNPAVKHCMLKNCSAHKEGGGMRCASSHPTIENCSFVGCSTRYLYGGAIHCSGSNPTIKSCKFNNCAATKDGGGIYFDENSSPRIFYPAFTNCKPNNINNYQEKGKGQFFFK